MGQLIVRNIEDEVIRELKRRAAQNGRSAEAEHREILRESLKSKPRKPTFKELLASIPPVGEDADFARRRDLPRPVDL